MDGSMVWKAEVTEKFARKRNEKKK